jgi:hypothetical protein
VIPTPILTFPLRGKELLLLVTLSLLNGCGGTPLTYQSFYSDQAGLFRANYTTFEHAFTDAGAEDARRRAQSQCAQKQVAVKTTSKCTLQLCTTSFQCMEPDDAAKYQPGGGKP